MNRSNARATKTFTGWTGEYKPFWKAKYQTVMVIDKHGQPTDKAEIFSTEADAERHAWRRLNELQQPVMVSSGTIIGKSREAAEAIFKERVEA